MPVARAATWGHRSAPSATASADSCMRPRHKSGAPDTCRRAKVTGRPMAPTGAASSRPPWPGRPGPPPPRPPGASSKTPVPSSPRAAPMPKSSSSAAKVPGTGSPSMARWAMVRDVEKPSAPAAMASLHDGAHGGDVVGPGRLVARPSLAHHVGAHRAVGDLRPHVDGEPAPLQGVEVLGEGLPLPRHPLGQRRAGDVLHPLHEPDEPVVAVGAGRGEAHPAVARHDGGHAVPGARRQHLVPGGLAVVVGVDVDPARRDERPVGVDGASGGLTSTAAPPR